MMTLNLKNEVFEPKTYYLVRDKNYKEIINA